MCVTRKLVRGARIASGGNGITGCLVVRMNSLHPSSVVSTELPREVPMSGI